MGDKFKKMVVDIIKSDEIKEYLEQILGEQTSSIARIINKGNEVKSSERLIQLNDQLIKEVSKRESAEKLISIHEKDSVVFKQKNIELTDQCISLEGKIAEITDELDKTKTEYAQCTSQQDRMIATLRSQINDGQNAIKAVEDELLSYKQKYMKIEEAYSLYSSLSMDVKQRIKNIFGIDNIYFFVGAATKWDNVDGIWNFAKRRVIEENDDASLLVELFSFLFYSFCNCTGNHTYCLINPDVGERFDSNRHSIKGTKTDGVVQMVLIPGIFDIPANKTVNKAVITVQ